MEFLCVRCGVKEEVIGDRKPRCLRCKTPLTEATIAYTNLMMSPSIVIRRFETVLRSRGLAVATRGRRKKEREAWITAVWAVGLREVTAREYWVEIETIEPTPDCKVHFIDRSAGYNHRLTHNVEVVEWDEHRAEVLDVIKQKCSRAYPTYFFLLVLARSGKGINMAELSAEIGQISVPFGEIWVLGRLSGLSSRYAIFMVHPSQKLVEFDLAEALKKDTRVVDFLRPQGRSKSAEFEDLGLLYLPIP